MTNVFDEKPSIKRYGRNATSKKRENKGRKKKSSFPKCHNKKLLMVGSEQVHSFFCCLSQFEPE